MRVLVLVGSLMFLSLALLDETGVLARLHAQVLLWSKGLPCERCLIPMRGQWDPPVVGLDADGK